MSTLAYSATVSKPHNAANVSQPLLGNSLYKLIHHRPTGTFAASPHLSDDDVVEDDVVEDDVADVNVANDDVAHDDVAHAAAAAPDDSWFKSELGRSKDSFNDFETVQCL